VPCSYRIAQEGLPLLLPFITQQRLTLSTPEFMRLLTERSLPLPRVDSAAADEAALEPIAEDPAAPAAEAAAQEPAAIAPVTPAATAAASAAAAAADAEMSDADEPAAAAPAGDAAAAKLPPAAPKPKGRGEPTSEKPRGPPIDDEQTLAQLAFIGNGCCVATLRCDLLNAALLIRRHEP